jgi:hypothetical protein
VVVHPSDLREVAFTNGKILFQIFVFDHAQELLAVKPHANDASLVAWVFLEVEQEGRDPDMLPELLPSTWVRVGKMSSSNQG